MSTIHSLARRVLATLVFCSALLLQPPIVWAEDVEPLRSSDLEARLKGVGFDEAQRTVVLSEHGRYVTRFTAVVAERIGEWQALARTHPTTLEDARALQGKARAAAQAIDDAERPLLESIRAAARPDQLEAVQRVIVLLEIRRDLAFASTMREGIFSGDSIDVIEAVDGLHLPSETVTSLQPQLIQYLVERQAVVHRIRDASLNVALRRVEARINHPRPTQPAELGGENHDGARMRGYVEEIHAWQSAQSLQANAERAEAQVKSLELDLRTLDGVLPRLNAREQVHLLSRWWAGAGFAARRLGSGPSALKRAWTAPSEQLTADIASRVDAICTGWIGAWWPIAKATLLTSVRGGSRFVFGPASEKGSPKEDRAMAVTTEAGEAIDLAIDGKLPEPAQTAHKGGGANQVAAQSVGVFVASGLSSAVEFSAAEVVFDGEMISFDGEIDMGDIAFEVGGMGGFSPPSSLPQLMQFDEVKPTLEAAGVDASMMEVAKTAVDDLLKEENAILQEAQAAQGEDGAHFGGMVERASDGTLRPVDPTVQALRVAQRSALRARLLALEAAKLDEILAAVVPDAGQPCVAWIAPWRQFISAKSASSTGEFDGFSRPQLDPTQVVRSAKLSAQELCMVGPELGAVCTDLAARMQALAAVNEKMLAATPMATISTSTDGKETAWAEITEESHSAFIKFEEEARKLKQAARTATQESITRLKSRLPADGAQRLQDAWDDQLYSRDLKDPTQLTSRFESALAMTLSDAVRAQVVALHSSWTALSRASRDKIVALKSSAQSSPTTPQEATRVAALAAERKAQLKATSFERDETNRRVFRELCALLGAELSAKLKPLPAARAKQVGGVTGGSFTFTAPAVAAP